VKNTSTQRVLDWFRKTHNSSQTYRHPDGVNKVGKSVHGIQSSSHLSGISFCILLKSIKIGLLHIEIDWYTTKSMRLSYLAWIVWGLASRQSFDSPVSSLKSPKLDQSNIDLIFKLRGQRDHFMVRLQQMRGSILTCVQPIGCIFVHITVFDGSVFNPYRPIYPDEISSYHRDIDMVKKSNQL